MNKFDLIVIGGGSAGVRSARFYSAFGYKVALVEKNKLGGTCVNVGCVPKKIMAYAATFKHKFDYLDRWGLNIELKNIDLKALKDNIQNHISKLNHIYQGMLEKSGVTIFSGHAKFINSTKIMVDEIIIESDKIIIATGMQPIKPNVKGADFIANSDDFFQLEVLPKKAILQGMGYIALEFACILNGLGSEVTLVYHGDKPMKKLDDDIAKFLTKGYEKSGIKILLSNELKEVQKLQEKSKYKIICENNQNKKITELEADLVLSAIGRKPFLENLGLENTKVKLDKGLIAVDDFFQTDDPNIFALGDTINHKVDQLTPVATTQAMNLVNNWHNFGYDKTKYNKLNYDVVATAMFSNPEFATVGLTEKQANQKGFLVDIYKSEFLPMHEVLIEKENRHNSFVKIVVDSKTDKLLGLHIAGDYSAEILQLGATLIQLGATKKQLDETIGIHPTIAEEIVTLYNKA